MASQTVSPGCVIVADDGSCDGTREWIDSLPDDTYPFTLSYVTGRHQLYGLTVSENRAARFIERGRILFTNADLIHNQSSVQEHEKMLMNVVGGGRIKEVKYPDSEDVGIEHAANFDQFLIRFGKCLSGLSNEGFVVRDPSINFHGVWGGNFSMDASRFHALGGFEESYRGMYGGEEADLIQRFRSRGGMVGWVYNSTAYHLGHKSRAYHSSQKGITKYRTEHPYYANGNVAGRDGRPPADWEFVQGIRV